MAERYRLQALLTVRQRMKKRAEMQLALAIKRLLEARKKLERLEEERNQLIEKWKAARSKMANEMAAAASRAGRGQFHVNYLRSLEEDREEKEQEIEEQRAEIEREEMRVSQARRDYIDAAKQLQIMEKHKELWQKKVQHELSQREQNELNELGNTIHQLRRWRGERSAFEA